MWRQWVGFIFPLILIQTCSALMRCPSELWDIDNTTTSCYYTAIFGYHDFYEAEKECKKNHQQSDLVTIDSEYELTILENMIDEDSSTHTWLKRATNYSIIRNWEDDLHDHSSVGNGEMCLMVSFYSWGTFPETEYCYQSYTKQVFCELAGRTFRISKFKWWLKEFHFQV